MLGLPPITFLNINSTNLKEGKDVQNSKDSTYQYVKGGIGSRFGAQTQYDWGTSPMSQVQ